MSKSDSQAVRVAVVTSDGRSGGTWRVWVTGETIYVALRALAGTLKTSLHPTKWRCAYTEKHAAGPDYLLPPGHDRKVHEFPKPPFRDGVQFAFVIGVKPSSLIPSDPDPTATVIDAPIGDLRMKLIRLYVTEPGLDETSLGLERPKIIAPSPLQLASSRRVWVVITEEHCEPEEPDANPIVSNAAMFLNPPADEPPGFATVGVRVAW